MHDHIAAHAASNKLASAPRSPSGVSVLPRSGRGRCLVATQHFSAGSAILGEVPLVAVCMPESGGHDAAPVCHHCLVPLVKCRSRCTCGAKYCSKDCKRASEAAGHALLCGRASEQAASAIARFHHHARVEAELPELELAARLVATLLAAEVARGRHVSSAAAAALALVQEPLRDVLHRDAAGDGGAVEHTMRDVRTGCELLRQAMRLTCGTAGVSVDQVEVWMRMEGTNSYGNLVALALLNQVGVAVAPPPRAGSRDGPIDATGLFYFVCMMNHSCDPNVRLSPPLPTPPQPPSTRSQRLSLCVRSVGPATFRMPMCLILRCVMTE